MTEQRLDQDIAGDGEQAHEAAVEGDELERLREELEAARQEAAANQEKFLRARADMENYKKRIERSYSDLTQSTRKELLKKLLAVKDNLERALRYGEESTGEEEGIISGVRLTLYQVDQILSQEGVQKIDAEGQTFDPTHEEAVQTVHDPNLPDHEVTHVVRQGYMLGDEVLRPAQVVVNVRQDQQESG